MTILSTEHVGHRDMLSPAAAAPDLSVPIGGRLRIQRALEMAEVLFVARVVEDGGIERWRLVTEGPVPVRTSDLRTTPAAVPQRVRRPRRRVGGPVDA